MRDRKKAPTNSPAETVWITVMALVDTSIWIDHLKKGNSRLGKMLFDASDSLSISYTEDTAQISQRSTIAADQHVMRCEKI